MKNLRFIIVILLLSMTVSSCQKSGLRGTGFSTAGDINEPIPLDELPTDTQVFDDGFDKDLNEPTPEPPVEPKPAVKETTLGKFSSNILNEVMSTKFPANVLPYWYGYRWNRAIYSEVDSWTNLLFEQISQHAPVMVNNVPADVEKFCPKFATLDKEKRALFWVRLISILASHESAYKTDATHQEPSTVGQNVVSSGLLQLSVESALQEKFKCRGIIASEKSERTQAQQDLFDPKKNLACALRIMNYFVGTDGVITGYKVRPDGQGSWQGLAKYWAPFRHPRLKNDIEAFDSEISERRNGWQSISRDRDEDVKSRFDEKQKKGQPWAMIDWEFDHPVLVEEEYRSTEPYKLTTILRLSNQTSFCF